MFSKSCKISLVIHQRIFLRCFMVQFLWSYTIFALSRSQCHVKWRNFGFFHFVNLKIHLKKYTVLTMPKSKVLEVHPTWSTPKNPFKYMCGCRRWVCYLGVVCVMWLIYERSTHLSLGLKNPPTKKITSDFCAKCETVRMRKSEMIFVHKVLKHVKYFLMYRNLGLVAMYCKILFLAFFAK
jgi:hypothetical protein